MRNTTVYTRLVIGASWLAVSVFPAIADTDGYFATGWGVRAKGMAGASIALRNDSLMVANNPAGTVGQDRRWDFGLGLFSPNRQYTVTGAHTGAGSFMPGTVKSRLNYFVVPDFGMLKPQKDKSVIGFALYGNGGMNTSYPTSANGGAGVFGGGATGVNLSQLFISGSYAKPVGKGTSVGAALIYAYQMFSADGLQPFSPGSTTISNNGTDHSTGLGYKLGVQHEASPGVRIGAVYQPKIRMSKFKKYSTLFADGGNFDIPENFGIGIAVQPNQESTVTLEAKKIRYSQVPSVGNPMSGMANGLGAPNGPGFGWKDVDVYKLGYERTMSKTTTARFGLSYCRQPVRSSEMMFNILAPGVVEWHLSAGLTKKLGDGEFSTALTYTPRHSASGPNPNAPTQTIELSMRQWELAVGYSKKM